MRRYLIPVLVLLVAVVFWIGFQQGSEVRHEKPPVAGLEVERVIDGAQVQEERVLRVVREPEAESPVRDGRLCLGTWQGIYLCEHRDNGSRRRLVLTLQGELLE